MYRQDNDKNKRIKIILHLLGKIFFKEKKKELRCILPGSLILEYPVLGQDGE